MHYHSFCWTLLLIAELLVFVGNAAAQQMPASSQQNEKSKPEKTYVIRNVRVIPMTVKNDILENATVVIRNKKILSINGAVPSKAIRINGRGKWLIPGLIDMHVHNLADINLGATYPTKGAALFTNTQDFMLLYVANGVTTAFELSVRVEHFGQRNEVVKGNVIGPRIALALLIDGGETGNAANTPADGRQTVRIAKAQGYEFIKLYSGLTVETFQAVIDEANKLGMKTVGHIPNAFRGRLTEAFVPHFDMVAHAEEYAKQSPELSEEDAQRFAQLAKANGTWLTPTMTTMVRIAEQSHSLDSIRQLPSLKYVHPLMQSKWLNFNHYNHETDPKRIARIDKMVKFNQQLVKAFKEAGVPVVAGTDSGVSGVVWGFALHDELELLGKAGLTPAEVLASATRLPATWLGLADKIGTVEAGKYADLVLLDANPLDAISNTRKIAGVFENGKWIDKKKIAAMLAALAQKNAANQDKYDWGKRKEY